MLIEHTAKSAVNNDINELHNHPLRKNGKRWRWWLLHSFNQCGTRSLGNSLLQVPSNSERSSISRMIFWSQSDQVVPNNIRLMMGSRYSAHWSDCGWLLLDAKGWILAAHNESNSGNIPTTGINVKNTYSSKREHRMLMPGRSQMFQADPSLAPFTPHYSQIVRSWTLNSLLIVWYNLIDQKLELTNWIECSMWIGIYVRMLYSIRESIYSALRPSTACWLTYRNVARITCKQHGWMPDMLSQGNVLWPGPRRLPFVYKSARLSIQG